METNNHTCNVSNHLDADALLPPRKRLLAGLKRQNSDVNSPSPSKSDTCPSNNNNNNNNNNNPIMGELTNPNLSIEEIVEASQIAAIEATKFAEVARAKAEEKAAKAAKAFAAAKNALDLVATISDEVNKKENRLKKKKLKKKHATVEELYNKKNKGNTDSRADEELARNLHRAINSSPRISKNSDTKSHNKHKKLKSSGFSGRINIVEKSDAEGLNTSKPEKSEQLNLDNGEQGQTGRDELMKSGNGEVSESFGRKRGRIKQKKLPLSICSNRDQTGPREEVKSNGKRLLGDDNDRTNEGLFSSGNNLMPEERASMSLWKCQSLEAPACVKQNEVMQL